MHPFTLLLAAVLTAGAASSASAAVIVNVKQVGADVLAVSSGSLNLSGLFVEAQGISLDIGVRGNIGYVALGQTPKSVFDIYTGFINPTTFGKALFVEADSGTGAGFAVAGQFLGEAFAYVPAGYVSGGDLTSTATFLGTTIDALGLVPGQYIITSRADSVTVNIGAPVPEASTWAMMILGLGAVGGVMRRQRGVTTSVGYA